MIVTAPVHDGLDRRADIILDARRQADEAFQHHVITKTGDERWRCGRPDTSIYAFTVVTAPGVVILYGDIGEMIFRHGAADTIAWLKGAGHDYLLSKMRPYRKEGFYVGDIADWLRERSDECGEENDETVLFWDALRSDLIRANSHGDFDMRQWCDLALGAQGLRVDEPWDHGKGYTWSDYFIAYAVQWFAKTVTP
jgi:hypothetical protein